MKYSILFLLFFIWASPCLLAGLPRAGYPNYSNQGQQTAPGPYIIKNLDNIPDDGKTASEIMIEISKWIENSIMKSSFNSNINLDDKEKGAKTAEEMIAKKEHAEGCTDFGIMFVSLARAKGFPTIFVDTYSSEILGALNKKIIPSIIKGHVFANIFFDGAWHVYDPVGKSFFEPAYTGRCKENPNLLGPEGCYFLDEGGGYYFITGKGLDLWDLGFDNRYEANKSLFQSYGLSLD